MTAGGIELFGSLYGTDPMKRVFSARERVRAMLAVEGALARVQGQLGIIRINKGQTFSARQVRGQIFF